MVDMIYKRCKADRCYVSYSSEASSNIDSRDVSDDVVTLAKLKNVHGNTQGIVCVYLHVKLKVLISLSFLDMVNVISSTTQKICSIVIDYSGF